MDSNDIHADIASDGRWTSRKFWGFLIALVLTFAGGIIGSTSKFHLFDFPTFCEFAIGIYALMIGANVTTKWVASTGIAKAAAALSGGTPPAPPAPPAPPTP
jgi:hypothetical protein